MAGGFRTGFSPPFVLEMYVRPAFLTRETLCSCLVAIYNDGGDAAAFQDFLLHEKNCAASMNKRRIKSKPYKKVREIDVFIV